ncbi:MAG: hypothetical protein M3Q07_29065 [Pseudobdellovibrionaceae bacterium]|uniref:hypothetical protein n=1 Tax=Oligoflexus sp. TaxID=1971216 RepID=UPI0027CC1BC4|nr:hypothetical protein [Oligoflexus sp.]MDQ3235879.1 hypothetical protein [Pseudobdellovibrionaceae bacterium]HYX38292.1 hypothetical protein [Oligoflexus sp.]
MHRVFDFTPADHEVVISRILVQVHHAVDEAFPHAKPASARFAKTAFVGYDEPTLTQLIPSEAIKEALGEEAARAVSGESPLRAPKPLEVSDEQPISQENDNLREMAWWRLSENMPMKQTLIGILALVLVGLLAYLLLSE